MPLQDLCPACASPVTSAMTTCANCGATLDSSEEAELVDALDDLETAAVADELTGLEEAVGAAADAMAARGSGRVGAPAMDSESSPSRGQADLSAFVARVEQNVKARARLLPPPRPNPVTSLLLVAGALTGAAGLFIIPATPLVGGLTLLAGIVLVSLGAGARAAGLRT